LFVLGLITGAMATDNREYMWRAVKFINRLNENNPNFRPYEIPTEYLLKKEFR
jgi:hypothetical protein